MSMPSLKNIKAVFDTVNNDIKADGEETTPYSEVEFYANQIQCIWEDENISDSEATRLATELKNL